MAGNKLGGQGEEFERLLILAEEAKDHTPKAMEALRDWRDKYDKYGNAMFFSLKQWDWLRSLAGEEQPEERKYADTRTKGKPKPDLDDDIPF